MREILFRGKRLSDGKLVYGDLLNFIIKNEDRKFILPIGTDVSKHRTIGELQVEVNPNTVGQYTGIKDKNGTKIFEGDICHYILSELKAPLCVKWISDYACFDFVDKQDFGTPCYLQRITEHKITVIGNIHDNPELIK